MYFPSNFAVQASRSVKLYSRKDVDGYYSQTDSSDSKQARIARKMIARHERLKTFQNLSVNSEFETCLEAYDGVEITEEQKEVLKKIHESTLNWMKGQILDKVLSKIEDSSNAKEIKELSETFLLLLGESSGGSTLTNSKIKAYIVNTL